MASTFHRNRATVLRHFNLISVVWVVLAVPQSAARAQVAATVNGETIEIADVERKLKRTLGAIGKISKDALPRLQAEALRQLIGQRLAARYLDREKAGVDQEEVNVAIDEFKKRLRRNRLDFDKFLQSKGHSEASFRRDVAWQMSWNRYAARNISDDAIKATFEKHRQEFDGTELRVSHILFKFQGTRSDEQTKTLSARAETIRQRIASGSLAFDDAVKQHSQGSKSNGGDLGFIRRRGSMPEPFSRAAFRLKKGELSPPTVSPFGVHLIRCTDVKPGKRKLTDEDVSKRIKLRLAKRLFDAVVAKQKKKAKIQYSGKSPYLKPGTGELVLP